MKRLILVAALSASVPAFAASFECTSMSTRMERMICGDVELSRLDDILASEYQTVLANWAYRESEAIQSSGNEALLREQRAWLTRRNSCRDRTCVSNLYQARIAELRHLGCKLASNADCPPANALTLPKTVDGRLMLLSKDECRTTHQSNASEINADCIEAGVYDPCEDSGGSWGATQCAWAHDEVAARRVRRAERRLIELAPNRMDADVALSKELAKSQERWFLERSRYCETQSRLYSKRPSTQDEYDARRAAGETNFGEILGYCFSRLRKERAGDLEKFVYLLQSGKQDNGADRLLAYLRAVPRFAPPHRPP